MADKCKYEKATSIDGDNVSLAHSNSSNSFHSLTNEDLEEKCENSDFTKPQQFEMNGDKNYSCNSSNEQSDTTLHDNEKCEDMYFIDEEALDQLEKDLSEDCIKEKHAKAIQHKTNGNDLFKKEMYEEAALHYTDALKVCPLCFKKDRSIFYANRAAARAKINKDEIREAIKDCEKAIELEPGYCKVILRRAKLQQDINNLDEALADFQRVLQLDPVNSEAKAATMILPQMINERNEKMKEEMMSKLKDLGNLVLKPFGLSTNNFELKQDSKSGGYNINFQQNPR